MTRSALTELLKESPFQQLFDLSCTRLERASGEVEIVMAYSGVGGALARHASVPRRRHRKSHRHRRRLRAVGGSRLRRSDHQYPHRLPAACLGHQAARAGPRSAAGRTVGVVDIDVLDDQGRLVAIGRGTYGTKEGCAASALERLRRASSACGLQRALVELVRRRNGQFVHHDERARMTEGGPRLEREALQLLERELRSFSTTNAIGISPLISSGTGTTAACSTAG